MTVYSEALARYLAEKGNNQEELARKINKKQGSVSRYANGNRFPSRQIAEAIAEATEGKVPVSLWIAAATKHFGIAA